MAVLDVERATVWRVGDCHLAFYGDGDVERAGQKDVDRVVADMRSLYLQLLALAGLDFDGDPGRELVLPVLRLQGLLANADPSLEWSYGVINGLAVPSLFVTGLDVPDGCADIVLCTDGYPAPAPTLAGAEQVLAGELARDPWRVGRFRTAKGLAPGAASFDDRAYLRVHRAQHAGDLSRRASA